MKTTNARLIVYLVIWTGLIFGTSTILHSQDQNDLAMLKPMDGCHPINDTLIDSGIDTTVIDPLIEFTNSTDFNGMYVDLNWQPIANPDTNYYYYVQASYAPLFDSIFVCESIHRNISDAWIYSDSEGAVWFRVSIYDLANNRYSRPSNTVSTIFDTTKPALNSVTLESAGFVSENLQVNIHYTGAELYPAFLQVSENELFDFFCEIPIDNDTGSIRCELSDGEERKYVYVRMVDKAGNISETKGGSIIAVKTSHNYPNPFNPKKNEITNLVFELSTVEMVTFYIYDLFGNLVLKKTEEGHAGVNDGEPFVWDGRNGMGHIVADGGYICVIKIGDDEHSRHKIAVAK